MASPELVCRGLAVLRSGKLLLTVCANVLGSGGPAKGSVEPCSTLAVGGTGGNQLRCALRAAVRGPGPSRFRPDTADMGHHVL